MRLQPVFSGCEVRLPSAPPFGWLRTGPAKEGRGVAEALFRAGRLP